MTTIKSFSDLQQSKVLAGILPLESADMLYWMGEYITHSYMEGQHKDEQIPIWSLAALLDVIPEPDLVQNSEKTWLIRSWINSYPCSVGGYSNPVDACVEMIIKLNELNLL